MSTVDKSLLDNLELEEREQVLSFVQDLESKLGSSIESMPKLLEAILSLSNEEAGVKIE